MKITEIDYTTTPETVTKRDATPEEIAQWETDQAIAEQRAEAIAQKEADRQALLDRLGITADEAALLLG